MSDDLRRLIAELAEIDPKLARRLEDQGKRGRPQQKTPAVLAAVWVAVMNERYKRSYGDGKRSAVPSVNHACQILADRGRSRRSGGGGITVRYRNGKVKRLEKQWAIRQWFYDAESAARAGDEHVVSRQLAWLRNFKEQERLSRLQAITGEQDLAWLPTSLLRDDD